ncbi:hypothetical protein ZM64_24680, partial [Salmonella enterica subsp. enterica]|nr:hypothetical protein [Salmonella enterica subsp. enterica]
TSTGHKPKSPIRYTNHEGLKTYCEYNFNRRSLLPIHTDQFGKKYYLCQRHFKIDPFYLKNGEVKLTPLISY